MIKKMSNTLIMVIENIKSSVRDALSGAISDGLISCPEFINQYRYDFG